MSDREPTTGLLPCPFCGGDAEYGEVGGDGGDAGGRFIQCTDAMCGASSALIFACGDEPEPLLAERWNQRVTPVAYVTRLRGALTAAEAEARRYAGHYPHGSDGRNTLVMLADRIAELGETSP